MAEPMTLADAAKVIPGDSDMVQSSLAYLFIRCAKTRMLKLRGNNTSLGNVKIMMRGLKSMI
jgi:hypothetical protein